MDNSTQHSPRAAIAPLKRPGSPPTAGPASKRSAPVIISNCTPLAAPIILPTHLKADKNATRGNKSNGGSEKDLWSAKHWKQQHQVVVSKMAQQKEAWILERQTFLNKIKLLEGQHHLQAEKKQLDALKLEIRTLRRTLCEREKMRTMKIATNVTEVFELKCQTENRQVEQMTTMTELTNELQMLDKRKEEVDFRCQWTEQNSENSQYWKHDLETDETCQSLRGLFSSFETFFDTTAGGIDNQWP